MIVNPGSRMIELLKEPASLARDAALSEALSRMSKEDFAKYAKELQAEISKYGRENQLISAIVDTWFQKDALAAREAAKQAVAETKNPGFHTLASLLGAAAARHDPEWATDHLLSDLEAGVPGWSSNAAIIEEVVKKDRKLADAVLQKFQDSGRRQSLLAGYVSGLSESDPLAAMDLAVSEKTFQRVNLIPTAARAAARTGVNAAKVALSRIEDPVLRKRVAWQAAEVIAEESVADPFSFLREEAGLEDALPKQDVDGVYISGALGTLVQSNPVEAVNWTLSLPTENQQTILGKVLSAWSSSDPDGMLKWAGEQESRPTSSSRTDATSASTPHIVADLANLLSAQALLKQGQLQQALQNAPKQVNELISGKLREFIWEASTNDPGATAEWVAKLPAAKARDPLITTVAEHYSTAQPEEAAKWIEQLTDPSARDPAVAGLVRAFSEEDPVTASEWAVRISDPAKREESVRQVWGSWCRKDEAAAREWLTQFPGISERLKKRLLAP
ncbi:MAG: hypothetical protein EOP84_02635 [Verrucomicrobiaceae bacterium]|nr:MAG: hypothetical protein EOP84_02635 [Verrucomicrobiaceae bacterium]